MIKNSRKRGIDMLTPKQLDTKIKKIVEKISKEAKRTFREGKIPLILYENDLCCQIVHRLYPILKGKGYQIYTEYAVLKKHKKGDKRKTSISYDFVICSKESLVDSLKLNKNKNFYNFENPKKFTAIFELKAKFGNSLQGIEWHIGNDLDKLKEYKADYKYMIFFDFNKNNLSEEKVKEIERETKKFGITLLYERTNPHSLPQRVS